MKVMALMGSPHAGNTLDLTRCIESKIKKLGDLDFEYLHLKDVDLNGCRGCFVCFLKGVEACPVKDDQAEILKKLDEADGVVLVSPVYSMTVSYLYKMFLDRFAWIFHRPRFFGKYAIAVAAAGGPGLDETLKYMGGMAEGWGFELVGKLGYFMPPKNTKLKPMMKRKDKTDEVVKTFYEKLVNKPPRRLTKNDHLHFHSMRVIYGHCEEMSPYDYQYFKQNGWFDPSRDYFFDNVIHNPLGKIVGRTMAKLMESQLTN